MKREIGGDDDISISYYSVEEFDYKNLEGYS